MNSSRTQYKDNSANNKTSNSMKNTRVTYQYRDAANYKTPNSVVLKGAMSGKDIETLIQVYGEGTDDGFDPTKLRGIPSMAPGVEHPDYDPELDHPLHEICMIELTHDLPDSEVTVEMFLADILKSVC